MPNNVPWQRKQRKVIAAALAGAVAVAILVAAISSGVTAGDMFVNARAQQQRPENHYYNLSSTINTSGSASVKVMPDKVSVSIGVETDGQTAAEAASNNAALVNQILEALKKIGVTDDQISTSYYNVYPVYESQYPPPCIMKGESAQGQPMSSPPPAPSSNASGSVESSTTPAPTAPADSGQARPNIYPPPPDCQGSSNIIVGYKASNNLNVVTDVQNDGGQNVGKIIDTAVGAGATNVSGAYFFISPDRQEKIRDDLIAEAIGNAKNRAQLAADAVNMEISGVQSINLNDVYFPIYYKGVADSASQSVPTPIIPGEQEVSMSVTVTFFMK
jgi:uncharacterized protein YggE